MAKQETRSEKPRAKWGLRILLIVLIGALLGVSLLWEKDINRALGLTQQEKSAFDGSTAASVVQQSLGDDLNLHFVDVGQADACIIELPDDKTMIIDGGDVDAADTLLSYIADNIKTDAGETIEYFDYAILTHADADHCGSLDDVLLTYPAKNFYRPNVLASRSGFTDPGKELLTADAAEKSTIVYKNVIEAGHGAQTENVYINSWQLDPIVPEAIAAGEEDYYSFSFYGPVGTYYRDWNNYSPVMILEYQGQRVALSGDCEKEGEAEFVQKARLGEDRYAQFDDAFYVNVIKLGHHGSRTSSSEDYLEVMTTAASRPETLVIISCGTDNKYGHPHAEVIERLLAMGFVESKILRTDQNGTIALSVKAQENVTTDGETETEQEEATLSAVGRIVYGANEYVVRETGLSVTLGLEWRYFAIGLFVVLALIILFRPSAARLKKARRAVQRAAKNNRKK